ncbi:hypothetical protein [Isoalcanivorax indicus]|uniref:hypothetical protein n=1 Tax=Isoalcanivorax indicus TaxID=2202653 RepID=UPI000DBAD965|nr:hypothetical protein [Isoalcanivorax indicus]
MMSNALSDKRRAVYTGLKPFLPREDLMEALHHWETHYADRPRFTLQRFVADICRDDSLRARRSDILLSLVQAMNLPANALLPDPLKGDALRRPAADDHSADTASAFCALMEALLTRIPLSQRHAFRLDLLGSVNRQQWPVALVASLQSWLGSDHAPLKVPSVPDPLLQALVNRTYVVLAERLGPVPADRALADALRHVKASQPALDRHLAMLL